MEKHEHYYSEKPTSEEADILITIKLKHDEFNLKSSNSIFSKMKLDDASKLLIERCRIFTIDEFENKPKKKILDLGCGYGVIGISILRKYEKDVIETTFSDVNERALTLTEENLKRLKLKGNIVKSDLFEKIPEQFDTILSNPPMASGRKTCYKLIEDAKDHLNLGGSLQIVARHNKGGKMLQEKMEEVFGNVQTLGISNGFRVYMSFKE